MNKVKKNWSYFFIIYGIITAIICIYPFLFEVSKGWIPTFRCNYLNRNYNSVVEGYPFDFTKQTHTLGYTLYFPYLMKLFGITDGHRMFCFIQSIAGWIVMSSYPVITYCLTKSKFCALITPIVFHFGIGDLIYINKASEYWSGLWIILLAIPILFVLYKRIWDAKSTLLWCAICLLCSIGNALRGSSSMPVLFLSIVLVLFLFYKKRITFLKVITLTLLLICINNLLGFTIPRQVAKMQGFNGYQKYTTSPWHSILIGVGYNSNNEYGLTYSDDSARDFIISKYPDVTYLSDEYFDLCKGAYLEILCNNPGFVLKGYMDKFIICINIIWTYMIGKSINYYLGFTWMLLFIFIMALFLYRKKGLADMLNKYGLLYIMSLVAVFLSLYSGVLAYPSEYYIWGAMGSMGYLITMIFLTSLSECFNIGISNSLRFPAKRVVMFHKKERLRDGSCQ